VTFHSRIDTNAVVPNIYDFDRKSGSFLERLIFNNRIVIVIICLAVTVLLAHEITRVRLNANFEGTIPLHDPFMVNYQQHYNDLQSSGNALRIAVSADNGKIANAQYLETLSDLTNDVLDIPVINRPFVSSLWTPQTRWTGVDKDGLTAGAVVDTYYDGSPQAVASVMQNILKTGRVGELVSSDFSSSMIYAPLMDHNGLTNGPVEYGQLATQLNDLRAKYAKRGVTLYITGFAMVVGDMILGIKKILTFFAFSAVITGAMLYWFTRSVRCTLLVLACTIIAVIWELGLLPLLHYDLDPYSVLVPFLIFAIGMSHGAQKMNGVMQDVGRGTHRLIAARYTFRRLFLAGFTALVCDAVGFAVLGLIQIQEIQELAIIASCGVAILIFTNLILLPILLSFVGVSKKAALRSLRSENRHAELAGSVDAWAVLARFTRKNWAAPTIAMALLLGVGGYTLGSHAQIGIVGHGAPELRVNSQYNKDVRYIQSHYSVSNDNLIVLFDSPPFNCTNLPELYAMDRLGWRLQQMPQVQSVSSLAMIVTMITQIMTDDSPKWSQLVNSQPLINSFLQDLPLGYNSLDCSFAPLTVSLYNLSADSLKNVVANVQSFIDDPENQNQGFSIKLAGGSGGIAAATDRVIALANTHMLIWIYVAVSLLCFIAFRSWRAVLCAILPLLLTSMLCKALMVAMNIGITVATLPVVALGVGIGVDYALYILGVTLTHLRAGVPLEEAYARALSFTGRVVMLTGFTLALGVGTWVFAPIKFQADMGLLLAFMFLWNMFGALVILPALGSFLLKPSAPPLKKATP